VRNGTVNRLDLRFRVLGPAPTSSSIVLRVWRLGDEDRLIVEQPVDGAALIDREWTTFYFAPVSCEGEVGFRWEISADPGSAHSGVRLYGLDPRTPAIAVYGLSEMLIYEGDVYVTERLEAMPRAYIVYAAETMPDDAAVERLLKSDLDMRSKAVTASEVPLPEETEFGAEPAEITQETSTAINIRVEAMSDGLLVLSDQYYPGWRAYLDGAEVPLLRTNLVARGVIVPKGDHIVEFRFEPKSVRVGAGLSLLSLLLIIGLWAVSRRTANHASEGTSVSL